MMVKYLHYDEKFVKRSGGTVFEGYPDRAEGEAIRVHFATMVYYGHKIGWKAQSVHDTKEAAVEEAIQIVEEQQLQTRVDKFGY